MVTAINEEKRVKCSRCGTEQPDLIIRNGVLLAGSTSVLGYVCCHCGKVVHWGVRGTQKGTANERI